MSAYDDLLNLMDHLNNTSERMNESYSAENEMMMNLEKQLKNQYEMEIQTELNNTIDAMHQHADNLLSEVLQEISDYNEVPNEDHEQSFYEDQPNKNSSKQIDDNIESKATKLVDTSLIRRFENNLITYIIDFSTLAPNTTGESFISIKILSVSEKCKFCKKSFQFDELGAHQLKCAVTRTVMSYVCRVVDCGKLFLKERSWQNHKNRHTEDELKYLTAEFSEDQTPMFCCPYRGCRKRFTEVENLEKHKGIHMDETNLLCPEPGCYKLFNNSNALDSHKRVHASKTTNVCDEPACGKQFIQLKNLQEHQRTHIKKLQEHQQTHLKNPQEHQQTHSDQKQINRKPKQQRRIMDFFVVKPLVK